MNVKPAIERVTAVYKGTPRAAYRSGCKYHIVLHRCAGHRFDRDTGEWVKDHRVQVYRDFGNAPQEITREKDPGYIMYPSIDDAKKDFAL